LANANDSKAQICHYFGSKDRLLEAVWESMVRQM
jgi:AcrR family transcriptional regulator